MLWPQGQGDADLFASDFTNPTPVWNNANWTCATDFTGEYSNLTIVFFVLDVVAQPVYVVLDAPTYLLPAICVEVCLRLQR